MASVTLASNTGINLIADWSSVKNSSNPNASDVTVTFKLYASAQGTFLTGSHCTIDGTANNTTGFVIDQYNPATTTIGTYKKTVTHGSDGTKSIVLSAAINWIGTMYATSLVEISNLSGSKTITLPTLAGSGTAPTNPVATISAATGTITSGVAEGRIKVSASYSAGTAPNIKYKYSWSNSPGSGFTETAWITSSSAEYTVTDMTRGATFYFRVAVQNDKGSTGWSDVKSIIANSIPSTATFTKATLDRRNKVIVIQWNKATDDDGQTPNHRLFVSKNGGSWSKVGDLGNVGSYNYSVSGDSFGTTYKFLIEAHDSFGKYSTSASSSTYTYLQGPKTPTLTFSGVDGFGIAEATATAVVTAQTADAYNPIQGSLIKQVEYSIGNTSSWVALSDNTTTLNLTLGRGKTWYVRARLKDDSGVSEYSTIGNLISNSPPTAPTNLRVEANNQISSMTFMWDVSNDGQMEIPKYKVEHFVDGTSKGTADANGTLEHTVNISSYPNGAAITFKVYAYDRYNTGTWSALSGTFRKATPPTNVKITLNPDLTISTTNGVRLIEGDVEAVITYDCPYPPAGSPTFRFQTHSGTTSERSSNKYVYDTTTKRDYEWQIRGEAANDAGSAWSSYASVRSNAQPNKPETPTINSIYFGEKGTITYKTALDPDGHTVTHKLYIIKNDTSHILLNTSTAGTTFTYDSTVDAYETTYQFYVIATDPYGVSNQSDLSIKAKRPTPPTKPNILAPVNGTINEYDFTVKLKQSNFYGLKGTYSIEYKLGSGEWTSFLNESTSLSKIFDIETASRAQIISFRAIAKNEAGQTSGWTDIVTSKRNSTPIKLSNILPSSGYFAKTVNYTWTATTDVDNQVLLYYVYMRKNSGDFFLLGTTKDAKYTYPIPISDLGETTYEVKIVAEDTLGARAELVGGILKKPTPPTIPTALKPTSGYYEKNLPITWTHSNWYGQTGVYEVLVHVGGTLSNSTEIGYATAKYDFPLNEESRSKNLQFKIRARNSHDQYSEWVESTLNIFSNTIPHIPKIMLPINGRTIHTKSPKIVLKTGAEMDGQLVTLYVVYNGVTYNSVTHSSLFTRSKVEENKYVIFKPTVSLPAGSNTIEFYVNDGFINSDSVTVTVNVVEPITPVVAGEFITAETHNKIVKAYEDTRYAYSLPLAKQPTVTKGEDTIKLIDIQNLIKSLKEVTEKIDSYVPENNSLLYTFTYMEPVEDDIITAKHYNKLIENVQLI